jgi:predicted phosphohydrolase
MRRLVWITDIHLDFCSEPQIEEFFVEVGRNNPQAVLLGGDVSESRRIVQRLDQMRAAWSVPIYFVLGNHDFYGSSITSVRAAVTELSRQRQSLHYLTTDGPVDLGNGWGLVGHDGWADGRIGNYAQSVVMMYDYQRIEELAALTKKERLNRLMQLGD